MKRTVTLLSIAICGMIAFTSCNEHHYWYDEGYRHHGNRYEEPYGADGDNASYLLSMAQTLRGMWQGSLHTAYYDDNNQLVEGDYTTDIQFDQYDTNSINGRGVERDYDNNGDLVYEEAFSWYIDSKTEDIYLLFDDSKRDMVVISFHLDESNFYGTMKSEKTGEVDEFSLKRYTLAPSASIFDDDNVKTRALTTGKHGHAI